MLKYGGKLLCLLILFSCSKLIAQTKTIQQELTEKYKDKACITIAEEVKYSFNVVKKGKIENFVITENHYSKQFTKNNSYKKNVVVFYDSYSEVKNMFYKKNKVQNKYTVLIKSNYQQDGIFHDDVKLSAYEMEMTKNDIYETYHTKEFYNPRFLSKMYFQSSNPIEEKKIVFEVPDYVNYEIMEFNFAGYTIDKKEVPNPAKKSKTITYTAKAIQGFAEENAAPSAAKVSPHIIFIVKSYKTKTKSESFFFAKGDVYKWCKNLADSTVNDTEIFKDKLKEIVGNEKDSLIIMEKVFYWIQDHVRYVAFEDGIMGYKPQSADKVYNLLYGDCKGMANLAKNMLKSIGFDARLTWIGTTDIPYSNEIPMLGVYNHMICTVFLRGKPYYLDCTENFISIDDYAERIQGRAVMIESGDLYLSKTIPSANDERNLITVNQKMSIIDSKLVGNTEMIFNGEEKTNFLRRINSIKSENQNKAVMNYLKSGNSNVVVKSSSNSNSNDRKSSFVLKSEFEMNNSVYYSKDKKELIVLPEKDAEFEHFQFDSTRKSDYEFNNRYFLNSKTEIAIPQGYSVKSLPASVDLKNADYEFQMSYKQEGQSIFLMKRILIKNILLKQKDFKKWNESIDAIANFYKQAVIFKI